MDPSIDASSPASGGLDARFWAYAGANVLAGLGDGVRLAAIPLLAASLTRSPALVGAVAASQTIPWLFVNPLMGVLVDRRDRRRLMQLATLVRVGLALLLTAAIWAGAATVPLLCGVGFLLGSADTLGANAASGLLPRLIQGSQLERANAVSQGGYAVGETLLGPALGALLFTVARELPFSADAGAFLLAFALLAMVRGAFQPSPGSGARVHSQLWEGATWLWRHRPLRLLAALVALQNLAFGMLLGVLVLFVLEVLRLPQVAYGLLLGTMAVGGLLASLVSLRLGPRLRRTGLLRAVLAVNAIGAGAIWAFPRVEVVVPTFLAVGFLSTIWDVVVVSYRQREVPDPLLGRVTSAFRAVGIGATPVGAALGGVVAQSAGLRAPFLAAAVGMALALAISVPGLSGTRLSR